ncbi:unnamed protein product [Brassicogethes aeneus]|uniref:Uncharacterized protein n=1 Tax=Brassicogethes aeneus TaxID=1431903 RepID=A0A9P0BGJ8_BRAAE|nr:unnamed protein product [Brassicogethes aeneus]
MTSKTSKKTDVRLLNLSLQIENDYITMFPDSNSLYNKWDEFFNKLKKCCTADEKTEKLLLNISEDITEDSKNAIQITALSSLFPPKGRSKIIKSHWKPTSIECQESIISHVQFDKVENNLDKSLQDED